MDEKIKAATQEVLEILRKYDLSAFFVLQGRELCEVRWRFATWSCFEQVAHANGSEIRFRTRKANGERRSEKDIQDSATIAHSFATATGRAAISSINTWEALAKKLGALSSEEFRGPTPPWDFK